MVLIPGELNTELPSDSSAVLIARDLLQVQILNITTKTGMSEPRLQNETFHPKFCDSIQYKY